MLRKEETTFRTKANPGTREMVPKCFDKKRPRRSGGQVYLRKEGMSLPQLDNSAIRGAGTRFLRQRAVAAECYRRATFIAASRPD
jgi:hypothetical protein